MELISPQNSIFQMLSNPRLAKPLFYTQLLHLSIAVGIAALTLLSIISVDTSTVVAQIPSGPTEESEAGDQQLPIGYCNWYQMIFQLELPNYGKI